MAYLTINLLGSFSILYQGELVTAFESDKVRALLTYLVVENNRPHRRETLAGLLWPELPELRARRNLSQALYNLRQSFDHTADSPPPILATRQTLALDPDFNLQNDVTAFEGLVRRCQHHSHSSLSACDTCRRALEEAATLYNGPFLDGFSLPESPAFEEWLLLRREQLQRLAVEMTQQLVGSYQSRGENDRALNYARRWAELAPWQ